MSRFLPPATGALSAAALSLCLFSVDAARADTVPGGDTAAPATLQVNRWTEDWSQTKADADFLDKLKHINIGNSGAYLTLGGEARLYYTDWNHSSLGLKSNDNNSPTQTRLRLLADLHVNSYLRAYVELGDNSEAGATTATAPNRDQLDLYQGFIDLSVPVGKTGHITFRPGRFEMPLGDGKLVGTREGLNMRYTYQGAQVTYVLPHTLSVDVFNVRPVEINTGTFDDAANRSSRFKGVYVSAPDRLAGFGLDVYGYEFDRAKATLREGTGADERKSLGARLWKKTKNWDIDLEGVHQSGDFIGKNIDAYAWLFEAGYTASDLTLSPRFGLKANVFSGDGQSGDGTAGTYVAPSPRLPLISEAAFFGLSNLVDLYPSLTFKPAKSVTLMIGPDFLWRQNAADGVYIGSTGASFAPYGSDRFIGTDFNIEATWQVNRNIQFKLFETAFQAGKSFSNGGGKDGNYFGSYLSYKF